MQFFWENLANLYVDPHPGGLAPPPTRNPGSTPVCRIILENTNVKCKHQKLMLKNSSLTFDENTHADVEQEFMQRL